MNFDFFQCPKCGHFSPRCSPSAVSCSGCEMSYPIIEGIPVLAPDAQAHIDHILSLQRSKPQWFAEHQAEEKRSSYRAHMFKRREYLSRSLKSLFPNKAENILDLGCGDGNYLSLLGSFAHRLFGSDYNLERLSRAKTKTCTSTTLFLGDIGLYPARDGFFDLVFFHHVIEHIPNDRSALKTAHRILKPGGVLLLGTPNEGAFWWRLAYRLQPRIRRSSDHVHFYTKETISLLMAESGFRILEIEHQGWGVPHWTLDRIIRCYKIADDALELLGKTFFPQQASSLYVIAKKERND